MSFFAKGRDSMRKSLNVKIKKASLIIKLSLFVIIGILIAYSLFLTREKLMKNANEMGMLLAESYAYEEENRVDFYTMLLDLEGQYLIEKVENKDADVTIQEWMISFSSNINKNLGENIIDPYAVVDGKIIGANPWEGDADYEYKNSSWYKKALDAEGKAIYTDVYEDVVTGRQVITLAKSLGSTNNVLAFDITIDKLHAHQNKADLPKGSYFYLFDSHNNLLYSSQDVDMSSEKTTAYLNELAEQARSGEMHSYDAIVKDINGESSGIYFYLLNNDWISVITIPVNSILQDGWDDTIVFLFILCIACFITIMLLTLQTYKESKKNQFSSDTLHILGDSYYAIYRINVETETYTTIKSVEDIKQRLGTHGDYQQFIDVMKEVVKPEIYNEFTESFSIRNIRKLMQEGVREFGGDYKRRFGDEYRWVNIRVIYNDSLEINEVILCFREIDESKKRELRQYELLKTSLETANITVKKKLAFFNNASHDMRTPLNAVLGLTELIKKKGVEDEQIRDYINKIDKSGQQLLTLINDILEMSRLEQGKGEYLNYQPMDLVQCIEEGVSTFTELAKKEHKNIELEVDVTNPNVLCDAARLHQILNNLISNALKYSMENASIYVSLKELYHQQNYSKYQISVQDTGIGMTDEFLEQIFEPFTRETTFMPNNVHGTGLGMPIVKALVQQMSGEITVHSELGKGSTFTVIIPLQISEKKKENEEIAVHEDTFVLDGKVILLAEDNEINMEIAKETLSMLGADVIEAWNGEEAVDAYVRNEHKIDIILMDMQMPEMDGCTAAKYIRNLDSRKAKTIPIIAVTANVFAEDIAKTKEAGMDAHIAKPIDFTELTKIISNCLENKQKNN